MRVEDFQRFCGHCGQPIPWERLIKAIGSRAKVFFCSDQHRFADANAKNRAAKQLRLERGPKCETCCGRGYIRPKKVRLRVKYPSCRARAVYKDFGSGQTAT